MKVWGPQKKRWLSLRRQHLKTTQVIRRGEPCKDLEKSIPQEGRAGTKILGQEWT